MWSKVSPGFPSRLAMNPLKRQPKVQPPNILCLQNSSLDMASSKQRRRMDAQIFRLKEKTSQIPSTKCSVFMAGNKLKKSVFCLPQSTRIQNE